MVARSHTLLMLFFLLTALFPAALSRLLHSIPEDTYAFPKSRVLFLNNLPLSYTLAHQWLLNGLRGGVAEFLDQPNEIESSQPVSSPTNYTLHHMKIGPDNSYLCFVPSPDTNPPPLSVDDTDDYELVPSRSWSLLQPLSGKCFYHRQGWFTYSYCHNEEIRQFKEVANSAGGHKPPQEDPDWEAYTLGKAPKPGADLTVAEQNAQAANLELARSAGSRYLVQRWGDGTLCDKTKKPREVEVQFHCSMTMADTILFVKEAKTCSYVLVINTPRLCGEPGFKPRRDSSEEHQIRCREIVDAVPPTEDRVRIPDADHPVKLPRRKPIVPAAPLIKETQFKGDSVDSKDAELLRKTLEVLMGSDGTKKVALEEIKGDKDNVMFEVVEEIDLTDDQLENVDKIMEALRAAGYDVKDAAGIKKENADNKKGKNNKRPPKGAAWHEEL